MSVNKMSAMIDVDSMQKAAAEACQLMKALANPDRLMLAALAAMLGGMMVYTAADRLRPADRFLRLADRLRRLAGLPLRASAQ